MTLDKVSVANALDVQGICVKKDWDLLASLDGGERSGKSSVGADLVTVWEPEIERDILCGIHDTFLQRYAWGWGDWYDLLRSSVNRVVVREEADFLGREAMTEINRRILRVLSTVGRRNNLMVLMFPDFWKLDPYARERTRIRGYVHARNIDDRSDGPIRGYILWYVRVKYPFPHKGSTVWWLRGTTGRFDHISNRSELHGETWARWREKEEAAKNTILGASEPDARKTIARSLKRKGKTVREIAELMDMARGTVGDWVKGMGTETEPDVEKEGE